MAHALKEPHEDARRAESHWKMESFTCPVFLCWKLHAHDRCDEKRIEPFSPATSIPYFSKYERKQCVGDASY